MALVKAGMLIVALGAAMATALFNEPRQSEDQGRAQLAAFAKTFSTRQEWEARAGHNRQAILRELRLAPFPARCDLKPIIVGRQERKGYTIENVAFEALPGFFVTGNLYRPVGAQPPFAAVLCPHGHAGGKATDTDKHGTARGGRFLAYTQTRCATLARMGAVVFAWDMAGWGESTQVTHSDPNVMTLQHYSSTRAVDFIQSLDGVDPKRLGVTGESGGGTQTFILTAIDDRVTASAPVVMVSAHFFGGCQCESSLPIHHSATHDTNNTDIAAMAAPRPLLVVSCGGDWTKNVPGVEFPYIWNVYRLYGATNKVENTHLLDEGHDYGATKRLPMYRFLAKHLRLNLKAVWREGGTVDESDAAVENLESLCVFGADHPRPAHALKDGGAVAAALEAQKKAAAGT
jgi:hypothetical protein